MLGVLLAAAAVVMLLVAGRSVDVALVVGICVV